MSCHANKTPLRFCLSECPLPIRDCHGPPEREDTGSFALTRLPRTPLHPPTLYSLVKGAGHQELSRRIISRIWDHAVMRRNRIDRFLLPQIPYLDRIVIAGSSKLRFIASPLAHLEPIRREAATQHSLHMSLYLISPSPPPAASTRCVRSAGPKCDTRPTGRTSPPRCRRTGSRVPSPHARDRPAAAAPRPSPRPTGGTTRRNSPFRSTVLRVR